MKKLLPLILLAMVSIINVSAQNKTNGEIYITHPAIGVVEEFDKAFVTGDTAKMATYLTDDFKYFQGNSNRSDFGELNKTAFLKQAAGFKDKFDYFSLTTFPGSYPDALHYQKDNDDKEITVLAWYKLGGIHKKTGVKIDAPVHNAFTLTSDNKIKRFLNYGNRKVIDEIAAGFSNRTNGKIYNHHENINTVRKAMYYFEKGDVDKSLSFYTDDARFSDINKPFGESSSKAETKVNWENFLKKFEIVNIEEIGYPDYLEYEIDNGRNVLSWWKYNLVRKSDKKKLTIAFHFSNDFDENGKITREMEYYGAELLNE